VIDHDNLEEFADGEAYDLEDASDAGAAFYLDLARETGGPVLEIACGTGRVAIPIARAGYAVTGMDVAPAMLARARAKAHGLGARWIEADARTFDLGERFALVFLTGNAFQAFLTRADQAALLARVSAHLADGGLFAFETRNPRWREGGETGDAGGDGQFAFLETRLKETPAGVYDDPRGRRVSLSRTQVWDPVAQILHWTAYRRWGEAGGDQTRVTRIAVRFTFPQELAALLHDGGFAIARCYGDWDLSPLAPTSPSIIVVCRRRA